MHRFTSRLAALAGMFCLAATMPASAEWVASWSAPPHAPLGTEGPFAAASYDNVTLSQILRISEGGAQLRVRFSNRYGPGPLTIGSARVVRIDDSGKEIAGSSRPLSFGGEGGAVIPRGAPFASDVVALELPSLSRIKVEFYLPKPTGPCTCHLTGVDELAVSPPGRFRGQAVYAHLDGAVPRVPECDRGRFAQVAGHHCRVWRFDHRWRGFNGGRQSSLARHPGQPAAGRGHALGGGKFGHQRQPEYSAPAWANRRWHVSTRTC